MKPTQTPINKLPWKNIFITTSKFFIITTIIGSIVGAIFAGFPGALGFLGGSLIVFLCFSVGIATVSLGERRSMTDAARALVVAYVVKVMVLGAVLLFVPLPEDMRNGWMLAGAIVAVFVSLTVEMRSIMRLRILYFDSSNN